jgi:hypothetical protein
MGAFGGWHAPRARADPPNTVVPFTAGLLDPAASLNHNNRTLQIPEPRIAAARQLRTITTNFSENTNDRELKDAILQRIIAAC